MALSGPDAACLQAIYVICTGPIRGAVNVTKCSISRENKHQFKDTQQSIRPNFGEGAVY